MRVYGPEAATFDGTWKPGDFEEVKAPLAEVPRKSEMTRFAAETSSSSQ